MLTVAWDVDDVLNELMCTWFETWWKPGHTDCVATYENISKNPPHRILGVEREEYLQSLDEFRLSGCYEKMPPVPQVHEWFKRNGSSFRHMAVTAAPRRAASVSASWLIRHFGDWIRSFHFIPSARAGDIPSAYESTKAELLKRLNHIDIFIDDNSRNVHEVAALGIRSFLVSRPWNRGGMQISDILTSLTMSAR